MEQVRHANVADFDRLMERVTNSFSNDNPTHPRFDELYPDSIRCTSESLAQWLIVDADGDIAAGMQIVPRPIRIRPDVELRATGLGNVFCYPPYRRRGYMSRLLTETVRRLQDMRCPLNMLGGDRLRYGRFGWEHAGNARCLTLGSNMMRGTQTDEVSVDGLRRWTGDSADARRMKAAYDRLPCHCVRTDEEFPLVLLRPGTVVWIREANRGLAYAAVRGGNLAEYAGDVGPFEELIRFLVRGRRLNAPVPPVDVECELDRILVRYAAGVSVDPVGMVRVVDLPGLLAAYLPLLRERLDGWQGARSLVIDGTDYAVTVRGAGDGVELSEQALDRSPRLSVRDMGRLLFGPFPPSLGPMLNDEFLRRAFPLPLYWPSLSHV